MQGFCLVKAVRIHEDGGPEVLRYEDVPDPEPGPGEVLVALRAAGLNHLDVWVRKGLPSVPKPRILGADGAGVVAALGAGVDGFEVGERVVVNPGIPHDGRITVIGEHTDGTCCELKAIPADQLYPLDESLSFEEGAAFPLVFETAYRMLVTKAAVREGEWVLIWGIGGGVALAAFEICRALGVQTIVTSSSPEKLERARELGADLAVSHADDDVVAGREGGDRRTRGRRRRRDRRRGDLGALTRGGRAGGPDRRLRGDLRPQPTGPPLPAVVEAARRLRLDDGHALGLRGRVRPHTAGRARVHVDSVFPLAEAAKAHERLESGAQFGKIVLRIPGRAA